MKAGKLRHRVTLQRKVQGRDTFGGVASEWVDVATIWASIEPLNGREYFAAQQVNAEATSRIRMRYRPGVLPTMRVVCGQRVFDIVSPPIDVDERNRELVLMVKELVPHGEG